MKRIKLLVLLLVVLQSISFAYAGNEGEQSEKLFKINNKNFIQASIPITFYKGLPVVEVEINNKVLGLILDTGANSATFKLKPEALKKVNYTYIDGINKNTDINGKVYGSRLLMIPDIKIGNLNIIDLVAAEELRTFVPLDGIIGNAFLKKFNILVDYPEKNLTLFAQNYYPEELKLESWTKISFFYYDNSLVVKGKLESSKELMFCLDTGSANIIEGKPFGLIKSSSINQQSDIKICHSDHFMINNIDFGSKDFKIVNFPEPAVDGFLGYDFFYKKQVFFDYTKQVLYIKF